MFAVVNSCTLSGFDGTLTRVEVNVSRGFPHFEIVGLADTSVKESRERIRAALTNNGHRLPEGRITVNLAPAAVRKHGPVLDLPIAVGILLASQQIAENELLQQAVICGELSLEGLVRPVRGVLSMAITAEKQGYKRMIVPAENMAEASSLRDLEIYPVEKLADIITGRLNKKPQSCHKTGRFRPKHDLSNVRGQQFVKRALEIVAAGGHNLLMVGPPGAGKTMLANCLPAIMPPLDYRQSLEVSQIYSVAGMLPESGLITEAPFRNPHHSASFAGIVGGGSVPRPGEISLAHHGILYLDEFPEFRREVVEVLRQPLEEGAISIARAQATHRFPARFLLVAAANPCPCGYFGVDDKNCTCTAGQIQKYRARFSGPIMDRIDLWTDVPAVSYSSLRERAAAEASAVVRKRVVRARALQRQRLPDGCANNGEMDASMVDKYCVLAADSEALLALAFKRLRFTARSFHRILKVARTIADLNNNTSIQADDIAEALSFRSLFGEGDELH